MRSSPVTRATASRPARAATRSKFSRASSRRGKPIIPVSWDRRRSRAAHVFPVLVGPSRTLGGRFIDDSGYQDGAARGVVAYHPEHMSGFIGGSATAMVDQIAEGYCLMHQGTVRGWSKADLMSLRAELDKALREVRSTVTPQNDAQASQMRNRKIGRLNSAMILIQGAMSSRPLG